MNKNALIIVDVQNDFCSGGALEVKNAESIIPVINQIRDKFDYVFLTKDWHPLNHVSFAKNHNKNPGEIIELKNGVKQILWPVHCVQNSKGADFHPDLIVKNTDIIIYKGEDPEIDSYSGFYDNGHLKSTGLAEKLREFGINKIFITGLATDYCVKFTTIDGIKEGFKTHLIKDACKAVNIKPDDEKKAIEEMQNIGAIVILSNEIPIHL